MVGSSSSPPPPFLSSRGPSPPCLPNCTNINHQRRSNGGHLLFSPHSPLRPPSDVTPRRKRSFMVFRRPAAGPVNQAPHLHGLSSSPSPITSCYPQRRTIKIIRRPGLVLNQARTPTHPADHRMMRSIGRARKRLFSTTTDTNNNNILLSSPPPPGRRPFQEKEEEADINNISPLSVDSAPSYYHLIEGTFSSSPSLSPPSAYPSASPPPPPSSSSAVVIVTNYSLDINERNKIDPVPLQDEVLKKVLESMNKDKDKIGVFLPTSQHHHHLKGREREFVHNAFDYVDQFQMIMDRTWGITQYACGFLPSFCRPSTSTHPPSPPSPNSACDYRPLLVRNNELQSEKDGDDDDRAVILVMLKEQLGIDEVPTRMIGARKEMMRMMESTRRAVNVEYLVNNTVGRSVVIKDYVQAFNKLMKISSQMNKKEKDKKNKNKVKKKKRKSLALLGIQDNMPRVYFTGG